MISRRGVLGVGALVCGGAWSAPGDLDAAYVNGRVWTDRGMVSAFGVRGDRIATVGDAATKAATGRRTQIVDLQGGFVCPGFIDNHTHFLRASFMLSAADLRGAASRAAFAEAVGTAAAALPSGAWLQGGNWDHELWGGELPTREWIDAVTPGTPVAVVRLDQHMVLLNSLALRLAGIDRDTPAPPGGVIERDSAGEPTGLLKDNAKALVNRVIPKPSDLEIEAALRAGVAFGLSKGVTQSHVTELDWVTHDALRRMRTAGETDMRFYSFVPIADWEKLDAVVREDGRGDDWVRWGGLKGLIDGSLGSRTALFYEDYADEPHNHGLHYTSPDRLEAALTEADQRGLHVTIHAIGDRGNATVLDMMERAAARNGPRDRRFRIEHAQHVNADTVGRFARQNVIASMQPFHAVDDGRWAVNRLGPQRLGGAWGGAWAIRSLLDSGARVTFGSDWPVAPLDPLSGVRAAVWRETTDGLHPGGWIPEQRITLDEALHAYTAANAYAGFQENRLGEIKPGYLADFVIVDTDLSVASAEQVGKARVLQTVVNGVARYGEGRL